MRYLLLLLFTISFSSNLYAARPGHCGNQNQRPCTVLEALPSCSPNLIESRGRCISKPKPKRPRHCGHHNQRPCNINEFIPSCERNLQEAKGRCLTSREAREANKPKRPGHCGRHKQRPCNVNEFIPSCDRNLQEAKGRCLTPREAREANKPKRPGHCGRHNQRPCNITEFVPSCDGGLVEARGRCLTAQEAKPNPKARPANCGRSSQKPCTFLEFFPSCEKGLVESGGLCKASKGGILDTVKQSTGVSSNIGTGTLETTSGITSGTGSNQRPSYTTEETVNVGSNETVTAPPNRTPGCGGHNEPKCEYASAETHTKRKRCEVGHIEQNGRCYLCPDGYTRDGNFNTLSGNAGCHTRVLGRWTAAIDQGPITSLCQDDYKPDVFGDFCFKCPANYEPSLYAKDGITACTIQAEWTCDEGYVLEPFAKQCTAETAVVTEDLAQQVFYNEIESIVGAHRVRVELDAPQDSSFNDSRIQYQRVSGQGLAATLERYPTMTMGLMAEAGLGANFSTEEGISINRRTFGYFPYASGAWGAIIGLNGTAAYNHSYWLTEFDSLPEILHGYSFGIVEALAAGNSTTSAIQEARDRRDFLRDAKDAFIRKGGRLRPGLAAFVTIWFADNDGTVGDYQGFTISSGAGVNISWDGGYSKRAVSTLGADLAHDAAKEIGTEIWRRNAPSR